MPINSTTANTTHLPQFTEFKEIVTIQIAINRKAAFCLRPANPRKKSALNSSSASSGSDNSDRRDLMGSNSVSDSFLRQ